MSDLLENLARNNPAEPAPGPPEKRARQDTGSMALADALRSIFLVLKFVMVGVVIAFLLSGWFMVESNEVAVVMRFGKPVGAGDLALKRPGLHVAFPYPIDEIVRIPVGESHSVSSSTGWYFISAEDAALGRKPSEFQELMPGVDGYLLAADGNIIHAEATLKYRIADPVVYAFKHTDATDILRNALNRALIHAASEFTADRAIYRDKISFKESVLGHFNELLVDHPLGITLGPFDVKVIAPIAVRKAFEDVLAAEQERGKRINDAQGEAKTIVQTAQGEANSIIGMGVTVSNRLVLSVGAEARSFTDQYPYYLDNPGLFMRRLSAETFKEVLAGAQDTFFIPLRADGSSREIKLQLNRTPQERKEVLRTGR